MGDETIACWEKTKPKLHMSSQLLHSQGIQRSLNKSISLKDKTILKHMMDTYVPSLCLSKMQYLEAWCHFFVDPLLGFLGRQPRRDYRKEAQESSRAAEAAKTHLQEAEDGDGGV